MSKTRKRSKRLPFAVLMIILAVAAIYYAYTYFHDRDNTARLSGNVEVHFIDVGQGDSCLIISSTGTTVLIDAGDEKSSRETAHPTVEYLDSLDITAIDYMVITHYDQDHIGGADDVISALEVRNFLMPDYMPETQCGQRLMDAVDNEGAQVVHPDAGYTLELGGAAEMKVLSSAEITDNGRNNDSIVTRLEYGEVSFLFTGDAEAEREEQLLESCRSELSSDVLKVGHHGSNTSSTEAFLEAVSPSIAVISCGEGNSYGHPHSQTLEALEAISCRVIRTDLVGDIVLTTDGATINSNQSYSASGVVFDTNYRLAAGKAAIFAEQAPLSLDTRRRSLLYTVICYPSRCI